MQAEFSRLNTQMIAANSEFLITFPYFMIKVARH